MNYANKLVIPKIEYTVVDDDDQTQEVEENGTNDFEALTTDELLLIAGSSDHVNRLRQIQEGVEDAYREVVEKLMRRTGILCKKNMDPLQKKLLKRLVGDFRRQVLPRPLYYNPGRTMGRREV